MSHQYQPTIGLEIHLQLKTKSKMFCSCANDSWKIGQQELKPNTNICPVCTGQPGALPQANQQAIDMVIKAGLALNCQIAEHSKFDRKNYFYPDLPKGYQISQYDQPLCFNGYLELNQQRIGITRIHLEEDTGKLIHPAGQPYSLIDYNRSGVPLMEMVTEPDIHSAAQAKEFAQELQRIFRALGISDADMEKSQMRCEVNISLSQNDQLGTKVEIKNLNSFKAVERAIEYEIMRQTKILQAGQKVIQETRGWDEKQQVTYSQRTKEEAHDYRYFPEPDLPPLRITSEHINKIKAELPELPQAKIERFNQEYGFALADAKILVNNPALADYSENVISELHRWLADLDEIDINDEAAWTKHKQKISKICANWLINKLMGITTSKNISLDNLKVTPENFAEFITLIYQSRINSKNALHLLEKMVITGGDPSNILEEEGLHLIEDISDLEPIVDKVIKANQTQVEQFKAGKTVVLKYLIGQVMKESRGKANPQMVEELLIQKLA